MHTLLIIFGLLLLVFGGGCVLLVLGGGLVTDPAALFADVPLLLTILVPFGLIPALVGWFMFRRGLRIDREKRRATATVTGQRGDGTS